MKTYACTSRVDRDSSRKAQAITYNFDEITIVVAKNDAPSHNYLLPLHASAQSDQMYLLSAPYALIKYTHGQTSRLVFTARLRPQFRTPPVRNALELRSLHAAATPVQSEYPADRLAAAAVPWPESP